MKNEEKLHDKVKSFQISEGKIYCYGNCIRVFEEFIDESLEHEKFKMENTYKWRINKLAKINYQSIPANNFVTNKTPALTPKGNQADRLGKKKV